MRRLVYRRISPIATATSVLLLASCAMPAQVRPPRTLEPGTTEFTVGLRVTALQPYGEYPRDPHTIYEAPSALGGIAPAFALRTGVTDRLELGGSVSGIHASAESNYQLVRSSIFDLSLGLDLGFGEGLPAAGHGWEFTAAAPLTAGLNLGRSITLIAMGAPALWHGGLHTQVGGGVDFRLFRFLALRPTASWLLPFPGTTYSGRRSGLNEYPYYLLGLDIAVGQGRGYDRL